MNNSESDGNNNNNIELNKLYNLYFANPKDIDKVYNHPRARPYLAGIIGGFVYDKNNAALHNTEQVIQKVYYRLPSLSFPAFFDVNGMQPNLREGRKQEIAEIYDAVKMMLSDIDKIKSIDTKKRMLYYFKSLINATQGCDISKDVSVLVSMAERRNNIGASKDAVVRPTNKIADKIFAEKGDITR